jgi:hypothetical protein
MQIHSPLNNVIISNDIICSMYVVMPCIQIRRQVKKEDGALQLLTHDSGVRATQSVGVVAGPCCAE